jgi:cysteine desulfurase/selenocysteine lyase
MIDPAAIRAEFPILARTVYGRPLVYLDNAATTQKPNAVLDSLLAFYRESNSNVHRGVHYLSERASDLYERARETVRQFIHARDVREIVFTHGTTEAINLVARIFGDQWVGPGDEIVVTEMEHHSNLVPWQMLCERNGAILKVVPFDNEGTLQTEALEPLLTARTRLFALSQVSNVLGTVNSAEAMIRIAHGHDVPVLLDAAQAVQHRSMDVQELDCDFAAFSGHKMYAETGIGILYGKQEWLERMAPCHHGGGMIRSVGLDKTTFGESPYKFEAGTPNIAGALSLEAAINHIGTIGIDAIAEHERGLMRRAMEGLSGLDGVSIYGTTADKCGALAFNLNGISAYDAATVLDKLGIAVRSGTHCAEPVMHHYGITGAIRASFAMYNTVEEIDTLLEGVRKVQTLLA